MRIGSDEHLTLLCTEFVATHRSFDPAVLPWPDLDETQVAKLRSLPIWDEAIRTERRTGAKVRAYAATEHPPQLQDAVALQGYEETRHARLLETLVARYRIAVDPGAETPLPPRLEAAFMRTGYGECIDSFFAFGLFALAREAEFLPHALIDLLEPIVQEEARHILFHVNWIAYKRLQQPPLLRPIHRARCVAAFAGSAYDRMLSARKLASGVGSEPAATSAAAGGESADRPVDDRRGARDPRDGGPARQTHEGGGANAAHDGFTASAARSVAPDLSLPRFVARCLEENDRRFAPYDARLLRPRLMPSVARSFLRLRYHLGLESPAIAPA